MSPALDPGKEARAAGGIPVVGAFDGYRAVAIFLIALFHIFLFSGVAGAVGDSPGGVAIFGTLPRVPLVILFVVSGFVLFLPTAARGGRFGDAGAYALRRAARILPAYWLSLLVAIVLLAVLPLSVGVPGVGEVLLHVTMLQTPAPLFDGDFALGFGIVASVWTLSVETVFYVLLPVIAGAYFRRPLVGLALAAALLVAWRLIALHADSILGVSATTQDRWDVFYASQFPSWGLSFAAGMTGAWAYVRLRETVAPALLERRAVLVAAAAGVATVVIVIFAGREAVHDPNFLAGLFARQSLAVALTLPLAVATAMVALALAPARAQLPFANRPLRSLGDISYGVYLIHLAVIAVIVAEFTLPRDGSLSAVLQWTAIVIPVSLAYAYLSAVLLERPLRRWARRVRPTRRAVMADDSLPSVSIVIPTYNRRAWLAGALDSVLEQDYGNLEALVVDDGSSDGTDALLAEYARRWPEHRFRYLRQENAGQARAINNGNHIARGEILGYLSDDDVLLPGAVSRLATELITNPQAAAVYPGYREIDADGRVEDTVRPIQYSPRAALRLHDTVIGPGGLARRDGARARRGLGPRAALDGRPDHVDGGRAGGPRDPRLRAARLLAPPSGLGDPAAVRRARPRAPAGGGDRSGARRHGRAEHRRTRRGDPQRVLLRRLLRRHRRHLARRALRRLRPPPAAALGDHLEAGARRRHRLGRGRAHRGDLPRAGRGPGRGRRPPGAGRRGARRRALPPARHRRDRRHRPRGEPSRAAPRPDRGRVRMRRGDRGGDEPLRDRRARQGAGE